MIFEALIVPTEALPALDAINASMSHKRLSPCTAADGRRFLPTNLLTDCGPGQTWEAYEALLQSLVPGSVEILDD